MDAVGVYVIIEPKKLKTRISKSGMEIPTELTDRFIEGTIISASSEIGTKEFGLSKGMNVLYDKHSGHDVKNIDGNTYRVVTCRDIAIIL